MKLFSIQKRQTLTSTTQYMLHRVVAIFVMTMMCCGAWAQTLTQGKPYALYSSNKGSNLYLDPETSNEITINSWSDTCILYFTLSATNSNYYSIKNKNGYYVATSIESGNSWSLVRTQDYVANRCDLTFTFIANSTNYRLSSINNTDRYLGVDNTSAGSALYYDKNTGWGSKVVSWTLYSVSLVSNKLLTKI